MRVLPWILLIAVAGCAGPARTGAPPDGSALGLAWAPVDSLDARLPLGIRVFAGVSTRDTLRAWAVRLAPEVPLRVELAADTSDGREATTAFAARTGACVALNGGYFNMTTGAPTGLLVRGGAVESEAYLDVVRDSVRYAVARGALGIGPDGPEVAWARSGPAGACRLTTPVANRRGAPAADLPGACEPWAVRDAIGGGPVLLHEGEVRVGTEAEVFWGSHANRHPRSAVGLDAGGAVWLVVVDGRQPLSRGVTLEELAALLLDLGAVDAVNLDGGGSSTLVVRPPDGAPVRLNLPTGYDVEREVSTALLAACPEG